MRRKPIPFATVVSPWQDLQVVGNVQAADDMASQRHDVVNLMLYAGGTREIQCYSVELPDSDSVCPCRGGLSGPSFPLSNTSVDGVPIVVAPALETDADVFRIGGSPLLAVVASLVLVVLVPTLKRVRMLRFPLAGPFLRTLSARVAQAVRLCFALGEFDAVFVCSTDIARFRHGVSL